MIEQSPRPLLLDRLGERGITQETITSFEIDPIRDHGHPAWRYPIYDQGHVVGHRIKAAGPSAQKYRWDMHDVGAQDTLYGSDCIKADHVCLLLEGEPDVWLAHSLRLPAVSGLGGAGTALSPHALHTLQARAPLHVFVIYDFDTAGRVGAQKAVRALRDYGLPSDALLLPDVVGHGGDFTDAYRLCGDRARFVALLAWLDRVPVLQPVEVRQREALSDDHRDLFNHTHDLNDLVQHVTTAVRQQTRATLYHCPFENHQDDTPSFSVYTKGDFQGYKCHGCGEHGDAYWFAHLFCGDDNHE